MPRQIILMDTARIERSLRRMAIQVEEIFPPAEALVIVGLNERGFVLAAQLADFLSEDDGNRQVTLHRLDVNEDGAATHLPVCTEQNVLIVDDVIFSGKTMFEALTSVCIAGMPSRIILLALVDRGHRRFPLQAAVTGINVPTKFGEHIEFILDSGKPSQVVLFKN